MNNLEIALGFGLLGALLGSFTTMLIWRLHFDEKGILWGRSKCPHCKQQLKAGNLIPVLSWLWQRGKCANCSAHIPFFYPLTELFMMGTFFVFTLNFWGTPDFPWIIAIVYFINVLMFYDAKFMEVDRRISIPAICLALVFALTREQDISYFAIGAVFGGSFYALQYILSKGRWVGAGDIELGFFMGLLLGWDKLLLALFVAYFWGALVGLFLMVFRKYDRKSALPMGAFLMPATLIFLYSGDQILEYYLNFIGL